MIFVEGNDGGNSEFRLLALACNHDVGLLVRNVQDLRNNMSIGNHVKAIVQGKAGPQKIDGWGPGYLNSSDSNYRGLDLFDSFGQIATPERGTKHKPENAQALHRAGDEDQQSVPRIHRL